MEKLSPFSATIPLHDTFLKEIPFSFTFSGVAHVNRIGFLSVGRTNLCPFGLTWKWPQGTFLG